MSRLPLPAIALALATAGCSVSFADADGADAMDGGEAGESGAFADGSRDDATFVIPTPCMVGSTLGRCLDVSSCPADHATTAGFCPGPASVQCCTPRVSGDATFDGPDTAGWCPTDSAARPNDGLTEEPGLGGCPSGMIAIAATSTVKAFCVDRFEASVLVVESSGKESSWTPYYPPPSGKIYRAVSLRNAVPQGYISGEQATKACAASKKRLCNNDEWLRACRGSSGYTYPYGNTREDGVCNDARTPHPAVSCFKTTASWIFSEITWPGINQQPITVDRTGSRKGCVTSEGAFDMMGNLHEWIYDDPSKYADPVKAIDFRGGFYADTKLNGEGCLYQTTAHNMLHWDYSTGFRCCADHP